MKSALRGRLLKGVGANVLSQVVTTVIQIVSIPLFLHFWGKELFGEWLILFAVPMVLAMSGATLSSAAGSEMTMLVSRGRRHEALGVFQSVWVLVFGLSVLMAILVSVLLQLSFSEYFKDWFHLRVLSTAEISLMIIAFAIYVVLALQVGLFEAGFRCEGNYALGVTCDNLVRIFEWALLFSAVALNANPVGAAFALVSGRLVGTLMVRLVLRSKSPWIVYGLKETKYSTIRRLAIPTGGSMGFILGETMSIQGMVLAVGAGLGPAAVAIFSAYRTVSRVAVQANMVIWRAAWPEMSFAYGAGDLRLARELYYRVAYLALWAALVIVVFLVISGEWIISIWTNGKIQADNTLLYSLLGVAIADSAWQTSRAVLASANRHTRTAILYIAVMAATILLSYVLMSVFGRVEYAALGLLVANLAMFPYTTREALRMVQGSFFTFLSRLLLPPIVLGRGKGSR